MIVEDHQVVSDALAALLNQQQDMIVVGTARTVAGSARAASELCPDVVILDFHLEDGKGADAARAIRDAKCDAPTIFLTCDDRESVRLAAIEAGASGLLHKSRAGTDVAAAIRLVAAGGSLFSPAEIATLVRLAGDGVRRKHELTKRERQVLRLMTAGMPNRTLAIRMGISYPTVRSHVHSVVRKLGGHSKLEIIARLGREGALPA